MLTAPWRAKVSAWTPRNLLLGCVAVGDQSREQDCRSAGHIRHPIRDTATGAGLGERERWLALRQQPDNDRFQVVVFHAVNARSEQFPDDCLGFTHRPLRLVPARGQSHIHLPGPGAIAEVEAGLDQRSNGPAIFSWTMDSPMPVVLNVRHTKLLASGSTRRSSGTTVSVNMGRSSRGGPGNIISQLG